MWDVPNHDFLRGQNSDYGMMRRMPPSWTRREVLTTLMSVAAAPPTFAAGAPRRKVGIVMPARTRSHSTRAIAVAGEQTASKREVGMPEVRTRSTGRQRCHQPSSASSCCRSGGAADLGDVWPAPSMRALRRLH